MSKPTPEQIKQAAERILSQDIYQQEPKDLYSLDFSWLKEKLLGFFGALEYMSEAVSPATAWLIAVGLVVVLFALVGHIAYSFMMAMRRREDTSSTVAQTPRDDPWQLAAEADGLGAQGHYADASRRLYLAALVLLEKHRDGRLLSELTNSEYLDTFHSLWVVDHLKVFAQLIDGKWYRGGAFSQDDFSRCQGAFRALHAGLGDNI